MANRNNEFLAMSKPTPLEEIPESNDVLVIKDLYKSYGRGKNKKEVLKGLNLSVRKGEVFGFIGKNGIGILALLEKMVLVNQQP